MIFLKIFDDREAEYALEDDYQSPIPEPLRWQNWAADDEGDTGGAVTAGFDGGVGKLGGYHGIQ